MKAGEDNTGKTPKGGGLEMFAVAKLKYNPICGLASAPESTPLQLTCNPTAK